MPRHKKRFVRGDHVEEPISKALRRAQKKLAKPQTAATGLTVLNDELEKCTCDEKQSRIVGMLADYELRRGAVEDAISLYQRGVALQFYSPRGYTRHALGVCRCLLALGRHKHAVKQADLLVERLENYDKAFWKQVQKAEQGEEVVVPERPHRVSRAAHRIARCFMLHGYHQLAFKYLHLAVKTSPEGAVKARLALAEMALSQKKYHHAIYWAEGAVVMSGLHGNSIYAFEIIIKARNALGLEGLEIKHFEWLDKASSKTVRARAIIVIVKALRSVGDGLWQEVLNDWMELEGDDNPIEKIELLKITLSELSATKADPYILIEYSRILIETYRYQAKEFLFAAKQHAKGHMLKGNPIPVDWLASFAATKFDEGLITDMNHALGRIAMEIGRYDQAKEMFQRNIDGMKKPSKFYQQALWNLAKISFHLEDYSDSAKYYQEYWESLRNPDNFRLVAMSAYFDSVAKSGDTIGSHVVGCFEDILNGGTLNWDWLLKLGGKIQNLPELPPDLLQLGEQAFESGLDGAKKEFMRVPNSSGKALVAYKLVKALNARMRNSDIISFWQSVPIDAMRLMEPEAEYFWPITSFVYRAYYAEGLRQKARQLADYYLARQDLPFQGVALISLTHGLHLIAQEGSLNKGFKILSLIKGVRPFHPDLALGYYWLALRGYVKGANITESLAALRLAANLGREQYRYKMILVLADLLEADGDAEKVAVNNPQYRAEWVQRSLIRIQRDVEILGSRMVGHWVSSRWKSE